MGENKDDNNRQVNNPVSVNHTELYTVNNTCMGCGGKVTVYETHLGFTAECYSKECWDHTFSNEYVNNFMHKPMIHAQEAVNRWNKFILSRKKKGLKEVA